MAVSMVVMSTLRTCRRRLEVDPSSFRATIWLWVAVGSSSKWTTVSSCDEDVYMIVSSSSAMTWTNHILPNPSSTLVICLKHVLVVVVVVKIPCDIICSLGKGCKKPITHISYRDVFTSIEYA